jgi:immune inhibitor A
MGTPSTSTDNRKRTMRVVAIILGASVALVVALACCIAGAAVGIYTLARQPDRPPEPSPAFAEFTTSGERERAMASVLAGTPTTDTDYWVLYGQLESETGEPASREPVRGPTEHQVGDVHTFWMGDEEAQRYWQIDAELRFKTENAYLYLDTSTEVGEDELQGAAELFQSHVYPTDRRTFGSERTPGIDNDPRITILVTDQMPPGIAGYFSTTDEYPRTMKPHSNEREMFYITSDYLDSPELLGQLLSHEFQHMIHWNQDRSEATWLNEGLSTLAEEINGYGGVLGRWAFWRDPDMQLTQWAEDSDDRLRNYAASKYYLSYLAEHYGGYEILTRVVADPADGIDGIENALRAKGYDATFEDVFADWVVANLIDDPDVGDGRYRYALRGSSKPRNAATLDTARGGAGEIAGWVRPFGADYVEIKPGAGQQFVFQGAGSVRLADTDPHGGQYAWWSNRRNMLSSSLTREVDLTDVDTATLQFWTWHDIEADFDYGYVAASTDDGRTWETLPGTTSTSSDPNHANYGHGHTGVSEGWSREEVDLGRYAGTEFLLRFWYITDPGLNQPGWLIDDISIPEIGFADDAEGETEGDVGRWTVDGFVRSSNAVPQTYIVQLVEYGPQMTVRRLELDDSNRAAFELAEDTKRAVLIVSGATRWTSEPAPYRVVAE